MSVKKRRDLLNEFEGRARTIADFAKYYHLGLIQNGAGVYSNDGNIWNGWAYMDFFSIPEPTSSPFQRPPHFATLPDGSEGIKYQFNDWAWVGFGGFRPKEGAEYETKIGTPELLHENVVGVGRISFKNDTDSPQEREHTFTERYEETWTEANHIAAKAAAEITQTVGYGSDAIGVQGETSIKASVETEAAKDTTFSSTKSSEDVGTWRGTVDAHHTLFLQRKRTIAHWKQIYTIKGAIDFDTWLFSEGDFTVCWEGVDYMRQCLSGVGSPDGQYQNWADILNRQPIGQTWRSATGFADENWFINYMCEPIYAEVDVVQEFDRSINEEDEVKQVPVTSGQ